jgi:hypothetical protein
LDSDIFILFLEGGTGPAHIPCNEGFHLTGKDKPVTLKSSEVKPGKICEWSILVRNKIDIFVYI